VLSEQGQLGASQIRKTINNKPRPQSTLPAHPLLAQKWMSIRVGASTSQVTPDDILARSKGL